MSDATLSPAEAGLEVARYHRDLADALEDINPDEARRLRVISERFEEAIQSRLSEWVRLDELQRHTGWSKSQLRKYCRELEPEGKARRDPYWEVLRECIGEEIPVKKGHDRPTIDLDDISGTARRLADMGDSV